MTPPTQASGGLAPTHIAARYILFAVIAGAMNLGAQAIVFGIAPVQPLALSILTGTGVGFVAKYLLDKHWIFFDGYHGPGREARKVILYGAFSVAMTLIFWAFEVGFLAVWGTNVAKYVGAVIGLGIGNFLKYRLDRAFTFNEGAFIRNAPDWKARSWS
jgi:putative flippase GtrA